MKNEPELINNVEIVGTVATEPIITNTASNRIFYGFAIDAKRKSGTVDTILAEFTESDFLPLIHKGERIHAFGRYCSHRDKEGHILLRFQINKIVENMPEHDYNRVEICGYLCNNPRSRQTATGYNLADITVAINYPDKQCDYIPCVLWGRNAIYANRPEIKQGTIVKLLGRIQSRNYLKKINDIEVEERTAYEVSISEVTFT